jgi:hypothetical protein
MLVVVVGDEADEQGRADDAIIASRTSSIGIGRATAALLGCLRRIMFTTFLPRVASNS